MASRKSTVVDSPIGEVSIDKTGSPVAVVKMDPDESYVGVPDLLQSFINQENQDAWNNIKGKIDYIHMNIDHLLNRLDGETHFTSKVKSEVKAGKKLLFKPNIVTPRNIDPVTHGEGIMVDGKFLSYTVTIPPESLAKLPPPPSTETE